MNCFKIPLNINYLLTHPINFFFLILPLLFSCEDNKTLCEISNDCLTYYGTKYTDAAYDIIENKNQEILILGESSGNGSTDILIVKLDKDGSILAAKTFGSDSLDIGRKLIQTTDGGYLLTGHSNSFGPDRYDIMLIKLNPELNIEWSQVLGGYNFDYGTDLIETSDNNYVLAGYTYSYGQGQDDMFLIKFNKAGDTLWTKLYGGDKNEHALSVIETADRGYLLLGHTISFSTSGYQDIYLIKTTIDGDTLWTKTYGGDLNENGAEILKDDTGYIIGGNIDSKSIGNMDMMVLRIDLEGNPLWSKIYATQYTEMIHSISEVDNGGYICAGWTRSKEGNTDNVILRVNRLGDTLWTGIWGTEEEETSYNAVQTSDGTLIVVGKAVRDEGEGYLATVLKTQDSLEIWRHKKTEPIEVVDAQITVHPTNTSLHSGLAIKGHLFEEKTIKLQQFGYIPPNQKN